MIVETRAQRIVGYLERQRDLPGAEHPRLAKLAGLIQRNGLLQTLVFLEGKTRRGPEGEAEQRAAQEDERLLRHLRGAVKEALGLKENRLQREALARCAPVEYLLLSEVALEVATWLARHADARAAVEKAR